MQPLKVLNYTNVKKRKFALLLSLL